MRRRKSNEPNIEMSADEMRQEIRQCAAQALVFAKDGDVSAMETMLEHAATLAEAVKQLLPRDQVDSIKRLGYQRGIEELGKRIGQLREAGNDTEAQRLQQLLYSYQGELLSLGEDGKVR